MSTSGLTEVEAEALQHCLEQLQPILDNHHLLGGNEARQAGILRQRMEARLYPECPVELAEEAQAFCDVFGTHLTKVKKQYRDYEEERARTPDPVVAEAVDESLGRDDSPKRYWGPMGAPKIVEARRK